MPPGRSCSARTRPSSISLPPWAAATSCSPSTPTASPTARSAARWRRGSAPGRLPRQAGIARLVIEPLREFAHGEASRDYHRMLCARHGQVGAGPESGDDVLDIVGIDLQQNVDTIVRIRHERRVKEWQQRVPHELGDKLVDPLRRQRQDTLRFCPPFTRRGPRTMPCAKPARADDGDQRDLTDRGGDTDADREIGLARASTTPLLWRSALSTVSTIASASSPAWAYCTSGLSWSWNRSGRRMVRSFNPPSISPVSLARVRTCAPSPPTAPSSIVTATSWVVSRRRINSSSSGLAKRRSATVVARPLASSASAALRASAIR